MNSKEYTEEWNRFQTMKNCIIHCLLFCYYDSARDGISNVSNFFLRMIDDITQSVISIETLAKEGIVNTCKRELRYLLELSIKSCFIENNSTKTNFDKKIDDYENLLNSSNINPINKLTFHFFNESHSSDFKTKVKKTYGYLSTYTHSSSKQIIERLERSQKGKSIGFEGVDELRDLNENIEITFSLVIVMIFHCVTPHVVSDYLVESDGKTNNWYFSKSKFISLIDERFDYKSERQGKLKEIKELRKKKISF